MKFTAAVAAVMVAALNPLLEYFALSVTLTRQRCAIGERL